MKGGPFKVSAHPFGFFDANPFKSERAGPTYRDAEKAPKIDKVFKPSSYPKVVSSLLRVNWNSVS